MTSLLLNRLPVLQKEPLACGRLFCPFLMMTTRWMLTLLSELVKQLAENLAGDSHCPSCIPGAESQSESDRLFSERNSRITASVAKEATTLGVDPRNTQQAERRKRFLRTKWGLAKVPQTTAMAFGLKAESEARQEYKLLCPGSTVITTGLWVNPQFAMLGCSPDALVHDPEHGSGLLEIKVRF